MTTAAPEAPAAEPTAAAPETAVAASPAAAADPTNTVEYWKQRSRQNEARDQQNHAKVQALEPVLRQMAEKLGIEFDGTPDPAKLSAKLDQANALARTRSVELAVFRNAGSAGADANALLDSRAFMDKANALDPDAADFTAQMAELVTEAAQSPKYAVAKAADPDDAAPDPEPAKPAARKPPAAASGTDFSGGAASARMWSQADLDRATAKGDIEAINKAIDAGQLVNIGIGPRKHPRR